MSTLGGKAYRAKVADPNWRPSQDPEWPQRFAIREAIVRPIINGTTGMYAALIMLVGCISIIIDQQFTLQAFLMTLAWITAVTVTSFVAGFTMGAVAERLIWSDWHRTLRAAIVYGIDATPFK